MWFIEFVVICLPYNAVMVWFLIELRLLTLGVWVLYTWVGGVLRLLLSVLNILVCFRSFGLCLRGFWGGHMVELRCPFRFEFGLLGFVLVVMCLCSLVDVLYALEFVTRL